LSDTYPSVSHLMMIEARHVAVFARALDRSTIAVVAPHAGRIEPVTGEIARAVAKDDHRVYCFYGLAASNNRRLHVTSTRFAEPRLAAVLRDALTVVTIHGCRGPSQLVTLVGGLNQTLREALMRELVLAGFGAARAMPPLAGRHPDNVVNRTSAGGVQLEISRTQRDLLRVDYACQPRPHPDRCRCAFCRYALAIRTAIDAYAALNHSDSLVVGG
jgi:phage replication-related protein YjqB (UPF0714/DUF867 family)